MPMKLYNANLSPFAARIRLQIRAKGLENEVQIIERMGVENYPDINPIGKVPCLDTGAGMNLPESETIAEFLEDSYPEPSLRGHTALGKARVRLISRLVDVYHWPAFSALFPFLSKAEKDPAIIDPVLEKLNTALTYIEHYIEGPIYASQGRFTLADCALMPALFFHTAFDPAFGRTPFQGHERAKAYYEAITRDDPLCVRVVEEMADALKAFMARRAAAAAAAG